MGKLVTQEEFIEKIKLINTKDDFSQFEYINNKIKSKSICPYHEEYFASPNSLLSGKGCPECKESKGEKFISKWLSNNNYEYTPQKRFPNCKDKITLPFDFHINKSNMLIEYDGGQHFNPIKFWGGEEALQNIIRRYNIKNEWAKENNYIIVRLNYLLSNQDRLGMLETINSLIKDQEGFRGGE